MRHNVKQLNQYRSKIIREHSRELVVFFNESGRTIDGNRMAIEALGYGEDIINVPVYEIFKKSIRFVDDKLFIHPKFQEGMQETFAYRKNQTCFPVELKIVVTNVDKLFLGACLATDISENKRMLRDLRHVKHELKATKQYKNEFVANITHELKTPVNGIRGLTENLMETELTPKQLETLNIIHRCCDNMNTLINNLLDFTKIGNNKLVLEKRVFQFRKFINAIIAFNMYRINEKGLKLIVNVANDIPVNIIGDECRLSQILNNLFSNAIKFTAVGQIALEVVKISQTKDEVELFFMVMDTGIGISLEEKDKLFQSFTQVDSSITRRFGGTGLGLSICKMLVKAMHGNISVESEKNKGSTFSFTVRLGVPEDDNTVTEADLNDYSHYGEGFDFKSQNWDIEHDYLGQLLNEASFSLQTTRQEQVAARHGTDRRKQEMQSMAERLTLCFEMDNWTKAEEIAYSLKKMIPEEHTDLKHKSLQLLLSIRSEEYDRSVCELNELMKKLEEVTVWKV